MTHILVDLMVAGVVGFWPIAVVVSVLVAVFGDDEPPPKKTIWNCGYDSPVANAAFVEELAAWQERHARRDGER